MFARRDLQKVFGKISTELLKISLFHFYSFEETVDDVLVMGGYTWITITGFGSVLFGAPPNTTD